MKERKISALSDFLNFVREDTSDWSHNGFHKPWFRGHSSSAYLLLPKILRKGNEIHEISISNKFRSLVPGFSSGTHQDSPDHWLLLMHEHKLPTRLLDWTESSLVALFFATIKAMDIERNIENDAAVYAMDPIELNQISGTADIPVISIHSQVSQTIKLAFGNPYEPVDGQILPILEYPIAVYPSRIDSRIKAQKSCITLHGKDKRDVETVFQKLKMIKDDKLIKYIIPRAVVRSLFMEINDIGITYSTLFPDLDGVSGELKYQFGIK